MKFLIPLAIVVGAAVIWFEPASIDETAPTPAAELESRAALESGRIAIDTGSGTTISTIATMTPSCSILTATSATTSGAVSWVCMPPVDSTGALRVVPR